MSFILDALRKSENERQRQASPHVSVTAVGSKRSWQPGWLALITTGLGAALLAVAIVWWFMQPPQSTTTPTNVTNVVQSKPDTDAPDPAVRNLAQEVRRSLAVEAETKALPAPPKPTPTSTTTEAATTQSRGDQPLTVVEAMAAGLSLPHLNLDIHVFAPQADGRFVFINARKYREGEVLREGPRLEEITSDGVILTFQGQRLLLPRD